MCQLIRSMTFVYFYLKLKPLKEVCNPIVILSIYLINIKNIRMKKNRRRKPTYALEIYWINHDTKDAFSSSNVNKIINK